MKCPKCRASGPHTIIKSFGDVSSKRVRHCNACKSLFTTVEISESVFDTIKEGKQAFTGIIESLSAALNDHAEAYEQLNEHLFFSEEGE